MKKKKIIILVVAVAVLAAALFMFLKRKPTVPLVVSAQSPDGSRTSILNPAILGSINTALGDLTKKTSASTPPIVAPTPEPARVSNYAEGTLLRQGSDDKVYYIDALGYRHWITSRTTFDRMGLSMSSVKSISATEMAKIPESTQI